MKFYVKGAMKNLDLEIVTENYVQNVFGKRYLKMNKKIPKIIEDKERREFYDKIFKKMRDEIQVEFFIILLFKGLTRDQKWKLLSELQNECLKIPGD